MDLEVWCLRQCCCISKDASNAVRTIYLSLRSGCVLWEGGVSVKFFQVPKEKSEKWKKVDYTNRLRRSRNVIWTYKIRTKFLEIVENSLVDLEFFRIFANFFITDSKSTSLDRRSTVRISFLSTSVPEMTCLEGCISRTVGPRDLVSEIMLLHFKRRGEWRLNHVYIFSFRLRTLVLKV